VPFPWQCPFCGHHSTIGGDNTTSSAANFGDNNKYGTQSVEWRAITLGGRFKTGNLWTGQNRQFGSGRDQ
jgi:hypothetical protein